jgi:demethylmenaquinone methyltransferase/2-methoxy-6-polyprenyl-1,4-benzoquinol methylase
MTDAETYIQIAEVSQPLMEPVIRSAIQTLRLPLGSRGLDAGCGIGLQALMLAAAVGPSGHVTGLDIVPEMVRHAEEIARTAGLSGRISFREGDVRNLPFDDGAFDWAWSSCCVGYASFLDPLSTIGELARVVKPGGRVAILVWSSEQLLPGYPVLEARLHATTAGIAPYEEAHGPESHFLRTLGWFRELGLEEPRAHTFVGDAHAPLSDVVREALIALIEMRWPGAEAELSEADRAEYRRLCLPDSPDFIVDHPDYYAFYTCTLFQGQVGRSVS